MKTDPNRHCTKFREDRKWALLHDLVAHPFMALTFYSKISVKFHDYTSSLAWR